MSYWILVVTSHKENGEEITPESILQTRFDDGLWGIGKKTPNRKHLKKGDQVVFYMGYPHKEFVASA